MGQIKYPWKLGDVFFLWRYVCWKGKHRLFLDIPEHNLIGIQMIEFSL